MSRIFVSLKPSCVSTETAYINGLLGLDISAHDDTIDSEKYDTPVVSIYLFAFIL